MTKPKCVKINFFGDKFLRFEKPHFQKKRGEWVFIYQRNFTSNKRFSIFDIKKCYNHVKKLNAQEAQNDKNV